MRELDEHDRRAAVDAVVALIPAGEALNACADLRLAGSGFDEVDRVIDTVLSAAGIEGIQPTLLIDGEIRLDELRDPTHGGLRSGEYPFEEGP
jgi:hypothetical protein